MILTPEEYDLWLRLYDYGIDYITLNEKNYITMCNRR